MKLPSFFYTICAIIPITFHGMDENLYPFDMDDDLYSFDIEGLTGVITSETPEPSSRLSDSSQLPDDPNLTRMNDYLKNEFILNNIPVVRSNGKVVAERIPNDCGYIYRYKTNTFICTQLVVYTPSHSYVSEAQPSTYGVLFEHTIKPDGSIHTSHYVPSNGEFISQKEQLEFKKYWPNMPGKITTKIPDNSYYTIKKS
jgi:hypothetical protein